MWCCRPRLRLPIEFQVARMIAQQEPIMHRMFADMDTLMR
jgi:hypothetical protein